MPASDEYRIILGYAGLSMSKSVVPVESLDQLFAGKTILIDCGGSIEAVLRINKIMETGNDVIVSDGVYYRIDLSKGVLAIESRPLNHLKPYEVTNKFRPGLKPCPLGQGYSSERLVFVTLGQVREGRVYIVSLQKEPIMA